MKKILIYFLTWRALLFIPVMIGMYLISFREGFEYTRLWYYVEPYMPVNSPLLSAWANFDGVHYIGIASRGYVDDGRFLPVYPLLMRGLTYILSLFSQPSAYAQVYFWSGMILSNGFAIVAGVLLYKLLKLDYTERVSRNVLLLLITAPAAFFFGAVYTESLFLFLVIGTLLAARSKKWLTASIFVAIASVTRIPGIFLILPVIYEYFIENKERKSIHIAYFGLAPLLLFAYMLYCQSTWGDFLYFIHAGDLGNGRAVSTVVFPLVTFYRYVKILLTVSPSIYEYHVALLEVIHGLVATGLIIYAIYLAYMKKMRGSYVIYTLGILALPMLSGTLTGFPRYMLVAFPLYVALERFLRTPLQRNAFIASTVIVQALLLAFFTQGYYIS